MTRRWEPVELTPGIEAALSRLSAAALRDGYRIGGELKLLDGREEKVHVLACIDGSWYEGRPL